MTISKALVPVDFSEHSNALIEWLPALKKIGIRKIWLLHVLDELKIEHPAAGYNIEDIMEEYVREAKEMLENYKKELSFTFEEVNICTIWAGDPAVVIVKQAEELGVDVIVMATGGKGWFKELVLGSTSRKVARLSTKPVILVKKEWMEEKRQTKFDHILASGWLENPEDDTEIQTLMCSLQHARRIAQSIFDATGNKPFIRAFVIVTKVDRKVVERTRERINSVLEGFDEFDYDIIVWAGEPVEDLIKAAVSFDADLVVIGSRGSYKGFSLGFRLTSLLSKIDIPMYICK